MQQLISIQKPLCDDEKSRYHIFLPYGNERDSKKSCFSKCYYFCIQTAYSRASNFRCELKKKVVNRTDFGDPVTRRRQ